MQEMKLDYYKQTIGSSCSKNIKMITGKKSTAQNVKKGAMQSHSLILFKILAHQEAGIFYYITMQKFLCKTIARTLTTAITR